MRYLRQVFIALLMVAAIVFLVARAHSQNLNAVVGRMIAAQRVVESDCSDHGDDGRCAFLPMVRAFDILRDHLEYFKCKPAIGGIPDVALVPLYEPMTSHDPGPVIMARARGMRCAIDPRTELIMVGYDELPEKCSRLGWKCNIIWIPDYDQTIAFIGIRSASASTTRGR